MALAVVSKSFYDRAFLQWRTQTLDCVILRELKHVYTYTLDADLYVRDRQCLACDAHLVDFDDVADRSFYLKSGICLRCREMLRSDADDETKLGQCSHLSIAGLEITSEWLQVSRSVRRLRYASEIEFELAKLVANGDMVVDDPFR